HDLAKLGYRVTVFESFPHGGGMLRYGIPAYRLPRDIIDFEIDLIKGLGVDIRYNVTVGKDVELKELMNDYSAVFLAAGAHDAVKLGIPGEDFKGLIHGSTYMKNVNLGVDMGLKGKKLAVVGGGFTAMDVSRSAIRLGVTDSYILYRRTRGEIPVNEKEIMEAEDEKVQFNYLVSPQRIVSNDGVHLSGIELIKNELGEPDASGRRRPVPVKGSEFILDLDFIVPAVSQAPDSRFIKKEGYSFAFNKWGNIDVDPESFETSVEGVFAAGDFLTGTRDVINVIAEAHKVAIAIDKFIRRKEYRTERDVSYETLSYPRKQNGYDAISRAYPGTIPLNDRVSTFKEVENTFEIAEAVREGQRCLSCDHVWSHRADECMVCANCEDVCPTNALSVPALDELTHNRHFNEGVPFTKMDTKPVLIDRDLCVRCGLCEQTCPVHCIEFSRCNKQVTKV
ncbi:MAG: FAD-dependent oxidoreductase, partial [Nitrospinota bacterium]